MRSALLLVSVAATLVGLVAPAAAVGKRAGDVEIVDGSGSSHRRGSGGSATVFSFKLPQSATCPRDSANGNYRVQSFLVPAGTDAAGIRYKSQGPDVPGGWAVYKTTSNAYIQEMTANALQKKGPGAIIDPPDMSFAVFTGGELTPGRYEVGLACSLWNETVKYWSTSIVISADAKDRPAHLRWRLVGVSGTESSSSATPLLVVLGVVAATAVVAVLLVARRRKAA